MTAEPDQRDQVVAALRALAGREYPGEQDLARVASLPGEVTAGLSWQIEALRASLAAGERLAGWKIGLTSRKSRDAMGPGVRPFGYILADGVIASGRSVEAAGLAGCRLEPELCLVVGSRLSGPAVTPQEARAAVRSAAPAFEIISAPLPGRPSAAARVASRLSQRGIVVGAPVPVPGDVTAVSVQLRRDGASLGSATMAPAVIDDPFASLARLCAALAPFDLGLEPGQRVITGSLLSAVPAGSGHWEADFGAVGTVAITVV